jgi:hypothetical protein
MTKRRTRFDVMKPVNAPTWLTVEDKYGRPLKIIKLPPNTDPRMVMIEQMARAIGMGFEVEQLPGTIPHFFAKRGDPQAASFERNFVQITTRDPAAECRRHSGCEPSAR